MGFVILMLLSLSSGPQAGAEPAPVGAESADKTIQWVLLNFPPLMRINTKEDGEVDIAKASGPMADIQSELVKALPDYQHRYQMVSFLRAQKLFESKKGFCTIQFLKSAERETYMAFGENIAKTVPPGLVVNKSKLFEMKRSVKGGLVDLKQLLSKPDFQLGMVNGRSFSPPIDSAVGEHPNNIFRMVTNEAMGSLFKMLLADRIDGILAYNLELVEEQERNPLARELIFIPLQQDRSIIHLPVACERSPWGEKTLRRISRALEDEIVKTKLNALVKRTLLTEPAKYFESPTELLR